MAEAKAPNRESKHSQINDALHRLHDVIDKVERLHDTIYGGKTPEAKEQAAIATIPPLAEILETAPSTILAEVDRLRSLVDNMENILF